MPLIALRGRGNSGKTTTLNQLHALMLVHNYLPVPGQYSGRVDFSDILAKSGKLIGITSYGDTQLSVRQRLISFNQASCDIMICACRTDGGSLRAITSYDDVEIRFIPKTIVQQVNLRANTNLFDAMRLLTMIEELI